LIRYLIAATLARGADAGAAVGLVLLAIAPAVHLARPTLVGGLLVTCLTAPHLTGPLSARLLDRARDGRYLLSGAFAVYGMALAAACLALGRAPWLVAGFLVVIAGICGPLVTGGLSSQLATLVPAEDRAQRRALGWDSVSYGIAGSAGPAAVAGLAAVADPLFAALALSVAAGLAAAVVLTLPSGKTSPVAAREVLPVRQTLALMLRSGPLRRVAYMTMVTAVPLGAVAVLAVSLGRQLGTTNAGGAALAAAFGVGSLLGSLGVTAFPLTGNAENLVVRWAALFGLAFALCAAAPGYPLAILAFAVAGACNAPFFTATLAARSAYSPAGARAQIFVSMAALKVATAALGTALAGVLGGIGPRVLLLAAAALVVTTAAVTVMDRRLGRPLDRDTALQNSVGVRESG
jgi:MFS family permease